MTKSIIILCSVVLTSAPALALDEKPCAQIYPEIFSVDDNGKVQVTKSAGGFNLDTKDPKKVTFSKYGGAGKAITVDLDDRGRAIHVTQESPGFWRQVAWGMGGQHGLEKMPKPKMSLGYRNGKCFVEKYTDNGQLIAHSQMCHDLMALMKDKTKCNEALEQKLAATINRYGGSVKEASAVEKNLGVQFPSVAGQQAGMYLERCSETPAIAASAKDEKIWAEANAGAAAPAEPPTKTE